MDKSSWSEPNWETLLQRLEGSSAAESELFNAFYKEARRIAEARISDEIQARVGPSTVASAAMKSLLHRGKAGRLPANYDEIHKLLVSIVSNKAASAARTATAQKRSVRREEESFDNAPGASQISQEAATSRSPSPIDAAAVRELARQVSESDVGDGTPRDRLIFQLWLSGFSASETVTVLKAAVESGVLTQPPLQVRTVQAKLVAIIECLRQRFAPLEQDSDELFT